MKKHYLTILLIILSVKVSYSLSCASELQNKDGTCIDETYTMLFTGESAYYACSTVTTNLWYYNSCTATVATGDITTDSGNIVAEYYSNDATKVSACAEHNGLICNVNPLYGFQTDMSLTYVGVCDASEQTCVKCSSYNTETKTFDGSGTIKTNINGIGDNLCESGCGANELCDEKGTNTWSGLQNETNSVFEAHCSISCQIDDTRCNADFGAHEYCDLLDPNDICNTDSCDSNNRLIDYNGNHILDSVTCDSSCGCDTTVDTLTCDNECGASNECNNQDIGYNIGNAGCTNYCQWQNCELYDWNTLTNTCKTTCYQNEECVENAVCDLFQENITTQTNICIIDSESPQITFLTPMTFSKFNYNNVTYSMLVKDNADVTLNCSLNLSNDLISLGLINNNQVYYNTFNFPSENWYDINFICNDDSQNYNQSITKKILYDVSTPQYSNFIYEDLTPTVDNSLLNGDVLRISANWSDNFELDYTELWSDKNGSWQKEQTINHELLQNNQSIFYFNTTEYGDRLINFKMITYDSANNYLETTIMPIVINYPKANITVSLNEGTGTIIDSLEFIGNGQQLTNEQAYDSVSTELIGDFQILHSGIGTTINNSFKLNQELISGVTIKISSSFNPLDSKILDTDYQNVDICNLMVPNQTCHVWVWMDTIDSIPPESQSNLIEVKSQSI